MIFCTIKSKPLALPWGRTPRLDSGVRVDPRTDRLQADPRTDRLIGGSADGSSTSGSVDGSLSSGPKPTRDWALPWPVIDRFSQEAQVIMWPKPRDLVYPLYVIKSPQSSMMLPVGYFLRAVINARLLLYFLLEFCFRAVRSSELVTLQLRKWRTRGVIQASVGVTIPRIDLSGFIVLQMANKHSIMTREMVESFCNSYYIPDEVHPTAPGRDRTITQFPEGKVGVYTRSFLLTMLPSGGIRMFLVLRVYVLYYPFGGKYYPAFKGPDRMDMGLLDYIRTANPRKVQAVEVQKGVLEKDPAPHLTARQEQAVQILSSNKAPFWRYPECFLALVGLSPYYPFGENTYPAFEGPDRTDMGLLDYIRTADPRKVQTVEVQKGEEQVTLFDSIKHCFVSLDAPAMAHQASGSGSGVGAEVFAPFVEGNVVEENVIPESAFLNSTDPECDVTVAEKDVVQRQPETSEESTDSFYETAVLNSEDAKRWYIPRWNITNDSLLDNDFSYRTLVDRVAPLGFFSTLRNMDYDQLFVEFNVGAARQICLGSEVRSRAEHELELKEKLRGKYDARGVLLSEKDAEIARLKSLLKEKETEAAEVLRLRDQVSVLAAEKSSLSAEVSALKSDVSQKDTVISLLDSRASHLKSSLDDSQAACDEAKNLISSLSSEKDGLVSEVSILRSSFRDFKDKMEAQQEEQAQELYNRVAELEAHVMDVSGRLEGEFYPAYLTALAGRRWLLTHGMELAMVKCLKSPEYQGILGHALGRAVDYGMQEGLAAGHEHGIAGTPLSAVVAYDPETAKNNYFDAVRALEEADFPLIHLLKSKKDSGMDEVLDCFLLDGPLANLPEAAYLQPCLEQLSVPIYYADVNAVVGETSLSFALLNVHNRAEGARKHAAALRRLMVDIVSHPLSSQNLLGEASTSAVAFCVDDLDTDEDLGSVVCMPHLEDPRFEILP
ncbi:hypothetical protein Tco_1391260 [Tanacetum coccineum]